MLDYVAFVATAKVLMTTITLMMSGTTPGVARYAPGEGPADRGCAV